MDIKKDLLLSQNDYKGFVVQFNYHNTIHKFTIKNKDGVSYGSTDSLRSAVNVIDFITGES